MGALFQVEARLVAPLYQRPYVWTEREWEALWGAIEWAAAQANQSTRPRPYFLGAMVLEQLRRPTARLNERQIIDGQQRLVTLQLCLAAIRDLCGALQLADYRDVFRRLTENDSPVARTEEDRFKVWPTNFNRSSFQSVMSAGSLEGVKKLKAGSESEGRIRDAYLYLSARAREWIELDAVTPRERVAALWTTLTDRLQVVAIDLEPDDDAQQIFEALNALGVKLLPADLVKNYLLRQAEVQGQDVEKLYREYWEQFDSDQRYWRAEVRQGRLTRPRLDLFLQHYLILRARREVLAANLFGEFREFSKESGDEVDSQLRLFREYASIYRQFDSSGPHKGFFARLDALDTTTVYPLLLEVFKRHEQEKAEIAEILSDLESYLVRRAVCGLTSKAYNRIFVALIQRLAVANDFSPSAIRGFLREQRGDSNRWPTDNEFEYKWLTGRIYRTQRQPFVRMILESLERRLRSPKTEAILFDKPLSIEHLLPKSWEKNWPLDPGVSQLAAKQRRDSAVQTIGNLTLVTQPLNSDVSNGPWKMKRPEIEKYSLLRMNQGWPEDWSENRIEDRGRQLLATAKVLWPHPSDDADSNLWQPPAEPSGRSEQTPERPTAIKSLQLEFWQLFVAYYTNAGSTLPAREAKARNWFPFRIGTSGIEVTVKWNSDAGWLGCELYIDRAGSKSLFRVLRSQREEIEKELNVLLDWQELPDKKACRMIQTIPADLERREQWDGYFAWCRERAETFIRVLSPRILDCVRALDRPS